MIAVIALSTVVAYGVQESFSKRSVAIHRAYAQEQEVLTSLRRILWLAGTATRDYFINQGADRRATYEAEVRRLRREEQVLLPQLRHAGSDKTVQELEVRFADLWATLEGSRSTGAGHYQFIQEQLVPRRDAAGQVLRDLEKANRDALADSEGQFDSSRAAAARSLVYLLATCLVSGLLVAWLSVRYSDELERQAAQRFAEMSEAKQQLEQLSARLMDIQEEERTRLSRELHDEIVQNVAVLRMEIGRAIAHTDSVATRELLSDARALAERTMRSVRDISMLLRPPLLDDLGLGPALQAQTDDFARRTGVTCTFAEAGLREDLASTVKTCVFRVVQEALHNAEKHSRAMRVDVRVAQTGHDLVVDVTDDGVGFPPSERRTSPSHLGVLGMKERAASLSGELLIESAPDRGTAVRLRLPLTPTAHAMEAHA
jgi:signal transduction histidine kinase